MNPHRDTAPPDPIRDEAMDWRVRHEEGDLSRAERDAFAAWLARSPQHRDAYYGLEKFWNATGALDRHPRYAAILQRTEAAVGRGRTTRRAMAAGIAAAVVGLGALGLYQLSPKSLANQSFKTAIGQQATVTLPDGSQLTLNTDTVVRTRADDERRLVYLDKGQAYFKVAHDRRHPFVVSAAGRTVTAIGTAFDVRVDRGQLQVVLVEGKVRVQAAKPPPPASPAARSVRPAAPMATDMSAGSQLIARDDTEWRLTPTNVERETGWLKGQLVFDSAPLSEVVEEMNRYSTRKIIITDPGLAGRRVGGNFAPGDVHGFAMILQAAGIASLREQPDGRLLVVASK